MKVEKMIVKKKK